MIISREGQIPYHANPGVDIRGRGGSFAKAFGTADLRTSYHAMPVATRFMIRGGPFPLLATGSSPLIQFDRDCAALARTVA